MTLIIPNLKHLHFLMLSGTLSFNRPPAMLDRLGWKGFMDLESYENDNHEIYLDDVSMKYQFISEYNVSKW